MCTSNMKIPMHIFERGTQNKKSHKRKVFIYTTKDEISDFTDQQDFLTC